MTQGIEDKVVVITGASSGLGEAAARLLRQGRRQARAGRAAHRPAAGAGEGTFAGRRAPSSNRRDGPEQVKRLVDRAVQSHGRIDVIINNAGLMPSSPLERLQVDEWDRMIDVNIKGVLYGIAAALPHMIAQKSGHIINVSSVAGHKVGPGGAVYAATKHAVRALSEGLRQEVKPYNIRTTIISPGAVATELTHTVTDPVVAEGMRKTYENAIPADSFARTVVFAMSQPETSTSTRSSSGQPRRSTEERRCPSATADRFLQTGRRAEPRIKRRILSPRRPPTPSARRTWTIAPR